MNMIAAATVAGVDPLAWVKTDSDAEIEYLQLVADKAIEVQRQHRIELAGRITENIAKLFGGKKSGGSE